MREIPLILIGGGFSCSEIIDLIRDINKIPKNRNIKILGILDDNKNSKKINDVNVIGKISELKYFKKENFFLNIFDKDNRFIRFKIIKKLKNKLSNFISLIHPSCLIGDSTKIGYGVSIYPNSCVFSGSKIGNFTNIMPNCSIASKAVVDENCFIGKDVLVGSYAKIKKNSYISNGSTVLENTFINEGCRVIPNTIINTKIMKKKAVIGGTPSKILFNEKI